MKPSILTTIILPASLAIIMLGMGLSLTIQDFKRVVQYPKATFLGIFNQIILLPIVAFLLIKLLGLSGGLAIGVMIIAACPGGTTSNLIAHLSKGDTALSVTLTAISTMITFFSIPFIVNFAIGHFAGGTEEFSLPVKETIGVLFVITILPVSIGMLIKRFASDFADRMDKPVRIFSVVIFVAIVAGITIKIRTQIMEFLLSAGGISLLLSITTMALGFMSSRLFSISRKQAITIAIESGIQNGTMAILIATTLIQNSSETLSVAPATYGLLMYIPGAFMIYYFGKRKTVAGD